jgi:outer membrane protein assembly factor BamB
VAKRRIIVGKRRKSFILPYRIFGYRMKLPRRKYIKYFTFLGIVGLTGCSSDSKNDGSGSLNTPTRYDQENTPVRNVEEEGTDTSTETNESRFEPIGSDSFSGAPMFQYDSGNTGYASNEAGLPSAPSNEYIILHTDTNAATIRPVVADGVVYVTNDGLLYAVDAVTGDEQWRSDRDLSSMPAVADGNIYFPTGSGSIVALDANTGEFEWKWFPNESESALTRGPSPVVSDGAIFVSADPGVHAVDAVSGDTLWDSGPEDGNPRYSPAVVGGMVYSGVNDRLYAWDAESGTEQWRLNLDRSSTSATVVADGTVYIVSDHSHLHAVDADSGEELWVSNVEAASMAPAVANGTLVIEGLNRPTRGIDAESGAVIWENEQTFFADPPIIVQNTVYGMASNSLVQALDLDTGETLWEYGYPGTPTVVDGVMYAINNDGTLIAYTGD